MAFQESWVPINFQLLHLTFHWGIFYWSPQMIKDDCPKPFLSKQNKCKRGKQIMELKQNNFRGHTCWWRNFHVDPEICKLVGSTAHLSPARSPSICRVYYPFPTWTCFPTFRFLVLGFSAWVQYTALLSFLMFLCFPNYYNFGSSMFSVELSPAFYFSIWV